MIWIIIVDVNVATKEAAKLFLSHQRNFSTIHSTAIHHQSQFSAFFSYFVFALEPDGNFFLLIF
jgi:hypothetical protein